MKVIITANEALDGGFWDELCDLKEWSIWCVNEGRMDGDEEIELTAEEAEKLGLIIEERRSE